MENTGTVLPSQTSLSQVSPSIEYKDAGIEAMSNEVCKGQPDAMLFCGLWFGYCHAIDDLIDNMEDGKPTTKPEDILRLLVTAAAIYNSDFYRKHQDHLFSMVLSVTNAYADSVAWERSPVRRRRHIADVLRCCGNEMFFMVACLIGGWSHMRAMSAKIRERSYVLQHDQNDNPN